MRKYRTVFVCFLATLLVAFVVGCGQETVTIPGVVSVSPAQGATGVGINTTISATFNEAMRAASITPTTFTVVAPGGVTVAGSAVLSTSGLVATFTPTSGTLAPSTTYTATITTGATSVGGIPAGNYVWTFTTITPPPTVTVVPANGATGVPVNQTLTATFSEAMNCTTLGSTTFTLAGPGTILVTGGTINCSDNVATFTLATGATLTYGTLYTATISTGAQNLAGQSAPKTIWSFTTTTPLPTVINTVPTDLSPGVPAVGVDPTKALTATFNEAMTTGTINSTNFLLVATTSGTVVNGVVTYTGGSTNTAKFTPTASLLPGTTYTATITTGVKDLAGQPIANLYTWNFMTGVAVSTTAPELVLTVPAKQATGVPINQAVSATFSEAMNPLTFTSSTFQLFAGTDLTGAQVAGTYQYDPTTFIATFTPTNPLATSSFYTATVTSGAKNLAGVGLGTTPTSPAANPWTFETGSAANKVPVLGPTIATFGGFAGTAGMTNTGLTTVINGNSGTTATGYSSYTGFHDDSVLIGGVAECTYTETGANIGLVTGTIYSPLVSTSTFCPLEGTAADIAVATAALAEANTAYTTLQGLPSDGALAVEIGSTTIYPGVWTTSGPVDITHGPLTLDAKGDPSAYFVFQIGTILTVGLPATPVDIILKGGAKASNIFWVVAGTGVYLEPSGGGTFEGTIIATNFIHVSTASYVNPVTVNGRLISLNASTTLVDTVINVPAP